MGEAQDPVEEGAREATPLVIDKSAAMRPTSTILVHCAGFARQQRESGGKEEMLSRSGRTTFGAAETFS